MIHYDTIFPNFSKFFHVQGIEADFLAYASMISRLRCTET